MQVPARAVPATQKIIQSPMVRPILHPVPVFFLLAISAVLALPTLAAKEHHSPDAFACDSRYFLLLGHPEHPNVVSPNGRAEIHLTRNFEFRVLSHGEKITTLSYNDMSCCLEVGWSPDSNQFFIMYNDGGAVGGFHAHIFRIVADHLLESPAPRIVTKEFESHHYSSPPGANIFFLDWTPDSRNVFLVAEVPPSTLFGSHMGFYTGFLSNASSGKILRHFGEKQTSAIERSCRAGGTLVLPKAGEATSKSSASH